MSQDDMFGQLTWLDPDQNLFGVRVLDCRPFSTTMISTTKDPYIAASFNRLRASDGQQHRDQHPADPVTATCELRYPSDGRSADGPLFVARQMEDKWDIYLYGGALYLARSWTGELIFRAAIEFRDNEAVVTAVEAPRARVGEDAGLAVRMVDFLIKSHLYGKQAPHPLPRNLPDDRQTVALYSFSEYGRWGSFASYDDTTAVKGAGA